MNIAEFADSIETPEPLVERPTTRQWGSTLSGGFQFPEDYRQFIERFGTGVLFDFFFIWNPFSHIAGMNFELESKKHVEALRSVQKKTPRLFAHWPPCGRVDGLIPFGKTANGDVLLWESSGPPNEWKVAISSYSPDLWRTGRTLAGFLSGVLLEQNFLPKALPDLGDAPRTFLPVEGE